MFLLRFNFINLFYHEDEFGHGHGKSPWDGVGGTVKRVNARMSLQRPVEGQILTVKQMHETASKNITGIQYVVF
jgi:hypothetical protein